MCIRIDQDKQWDMLYYELYFSALRWSPIHLNGQQATNNLIQGRPFVLTVAIELVTHLIATPLHISYYIYVILIYYCYTYYIFHQYYTEKNIREDAASGRRRKGEIRAGRRYCGWNKETSLRALLLWPWLDERPWMFVVDEHYRWGDRALINVLSGYCITMY